MVPCRLPSSPPRHSLSAGSTPNKSLRSTPHAALAQLHGSHPEKYVLVSVKREISHVQACMPGDEERKGNIITLHHILSATCSSWSALP